MFEEGQILCGEAQGSRAESINWLFSHTKSVAAKVGKAVLLSIFIRITERNHIYYEMLLLKTLQWYQGWQNNIYFKLFFTICSVRTDRQSLKIISWVKWNRINTIEDTMRGFKGD